MCFVYGRRKWHINECMFVWCLRYQEKMHLVVRQQLVSICCFDYSKKKRTRRTGVQSKQWVKMQWKSNATIITEMNIFEWYAMEHIHNHTFISKHIHICSFRLSDEFFLLIFFFCFSTFIFSTYITMHICWILTAEFFEWNN